MVTETTNFIWIKYHIKVTTRPISEALASQGLDADDLTDLNDDVHKEACFTARNPGVHDKGVNVYSIAEARLFIAIITTKSYEYVGRPIWPNIMERSWLKHFKSMFQIQDNWSNPDSLPEFSCIMPVTKLLDLICDHLHNKLGMKKTPILYVFRASVVPDSIRDTSPTLTYFNNIGEFHEEN